MSLDRVALKKEEQRRLSAVFPAFEKGGQQPFLLFPEFRMVEPVGLWDNLAPASAFFPFYNTSIILLEPFADPVFFRRYYGLNMSEVIRLTREEKILPLLTASYTEYPRYFDPLFREFFVPSSHRMEIAMSLSRLGDTKIYGDSRERIRRRVGTLPIDRSIFESLYWLKEFGTDARGNVLGLTAMNVARLKILGYDTVLQALDQISDHNAYLRVINIVSSILSRPMFSLGGYTNLDASLFRMGRAVLSRFGAQYDQSKIASTTSSLMASISVRLRYGHPANYPPLDFVSKIGNLKEIEENHRILVDLKHYLQQGDLNKAMDEAQQAKEIVKTLDREIHRIARSYKIINYVIHPSFALMSGIGVTAVQSLLAGLPIGSTLGSIYFPLAATFGAVLDMSVEKVRERLNLVSEFLAGAFSKVGTAPMLLWKREKLAG